MARVQSPEFLKYKGKIGEIATNADRAKGAAKGGKVVQERRKIKDILESILDEKVIHEDKEMTREEKLCYELLGDGNKAKVFEVVRDTKGEKPTNVIEMKAEITPSKASEFSQRILGLATPADKTDDK